MTGEDRINNMFAQFIRMRQSGRTRDEAWRALEAEIIVLDPSAREHLVTLLRSWEAKDGRDFQPPQAADPYETHYRPPEGLAEVRQQMKNATPKGIRRISSGAKKTGLPAAPDTNAAPPSTLNKGKTVACPECAQLNADHEVYCYRCGTLLTAKPEVNDKTRQLDARRIDNAFFGDTMWLVLRVHEAKDMIRVQPGKNELVIGRRSPESVMIPDIDLSSYQADTKGVSRLHAALRRHGTTLVLTDMGSLNHTHINGQRVHTHEVRVVHDGDELRFGQLRVNVYFERE